MTAGQRPYTDHMRSGAKTPGDSVDVVRRLPV
jgi:hypothetical protein